MIIYDESSRKQLSSITILLTPQEADELAGALARLTSEPGDHVHIDNEMYTKEITVAIYTSKNVEAFAKHFRKMIAEELRLNQQIE